MVYTGESLEFLQRHLLFGTLRNAPIQDLWFYNKSLRLLF